MLHLRKVVNTALWTAFLKLVVYLFHNSQRINLFDFMHKYFSALRLEVFLITNIVIFFDY